jgi:DNA-binding NarL/FixJ family response regulator
MNTTTLIGVLMIEDEKIIIQGVKASLRCSHDKFRISESFCNVNDAVEKITKHTFDIILLDLWIKNTSPVDNVTKLKQAFPNKPIIIYSGEESEEWKERMLKMGVAVFVSKMAPESKLKSILRRVYDGEILKTTTESICNYNSNESSNAFRFKKDNLPKIDIEIIEFLSQGLCLKEIGFRKGKSVSSINKILIKLRKSFHVQNNTQLVSLFSS